MSESETINLLWTVGVLVLVVSALAARRTSFGTILRGLAVWTGIGLILFVVISHRHELSRVFARVGDQLGLGSQRVEGETVRIRMSPDGHFWARATLNGVPRRMLIDSGATITAISEQTAQAAGIETGGAGFPVVIQTANGSVAAQRARIERVALGPLRTENLGVVVAPSFGNLDVLGMNFLSRLGSWRVENNTLILEPGSSAQSVESPSNGAKAELE